MRGLIWTCVIFKLSIFIAIEAIRTIQPSKIFLRLCCCNHFVSRYNLQLNNTISENVTLSSDDYQTPFKYLNRSSIFDMFYWKGFFISIIPTLLNECHNEQNSFMVLCHMWWNISITYLINTKKSMASFLKNIIKWIRNWWSELYTQWYN